MTNLETLLELWVEAKEGEAVAIKARRAIEDDLVKVFNISSNLDGTENHGTANYSVKVVGRMNRKIDADKLQEIASENDLTDILSRLFRWKPEINMTAWKAADAEMTKPLLNAITTTPSRPSFTIEKKDI
jgi:hypothetical protein